MIQAPIPANYGYATPAPMYAQAPAPQACYPQQPPAEYNAIKINIVDPKVNAPGSQATSPYSYPQAPVYSYPQATQAPVYYPPMQQPQVVQEQGNVVMNQPPMTQPQIINQQTVTPPPPSVIPPAPTTTAAPSPVTVPEATPAAQPTGVDVAGLTAKINSADLEVSGKAIEDIADIAQTKPEQAPQLLDTGLMEALLGVIGKDDSALEGPSEKQKDLRQQAVSGKQLSDEDMKIANTITPSEMSTRNKQYALFTTAILQNALIDEFKKTNNMTPDIKDLPGMEQIVTTIKDNANPMLRASGLAALAYNARPEYKAVMKEIFELSKQDADENVQKVAAEGLTKLETVMDAPQSNQAEAPAQAA